MTKQTVKCGQTNLWRICAVSKLLTKRHGHSRSVWIHFSCGCGHCLDYQTSLTRHSGLAPHCQRQKQNCSHPSDHPMRHTLSPCSLKKRRLPCLVLNSTSIICSRSHGPTALFNSSVKRSIQCWGGAEWFREKFPDRRGPSFSRGSRSRSPLHRGPPPATPGASCHRFAEAT
jgi:hypothetical protein